MDREYIRYTYEDDQTPIHLVWDAEKKATIEIFPGYESEMPISFIINMAMHMDLIDMGEGEKTTVPAMLCNVLKSITLGADGNISASYVDAAQGGTEAVNTKMGGLQNKVTRDVESIENTPKRRWPCWSSMAVRRRQRIMSGPSS